MPEERRVVTVLFADVTGSTALAESSDPEDVRALLGRYYAIARAVIGAHGGTLEKFIGDAVMAVFGIPQAHGDDAERALAAALALRDGVAGDPQTSGLMLRMGVNTGEVVAARENDKGDFLVTGDAVNVAARLQQHADPGAILVGERTRRAVNGFRFADAQAIEVKGKREPISGAILVERSDRRVQRGPFLGREHDLAQLDLVARRAFSERRPQLVTITAPAGTGKSRLVEEFGSRLGTDEATVATAQCLPYGAAVTFLPLRGLVRGLLRVQHDADIVAPLRETFAQAGYEDADARRLSGLIAVTLGDAGDSERGDRDQIFNAWRLLIEALASRRRLLVVFEDLHWASDTLLDLVEHVTSSRTTSALVMIALARPELLDRRPHWGAGRRNFTSIALEPLSTEDTLRLIAVLTEGVPGSISQRIVDRAGGNPFFAGELVRAYEEHKRAGQADDDIDLPDTVHATVLARLDALSPVERSVLEYAAIAGRTARVAAIRVLLPDRNETEMADALESLAERDMLLPQGSGAYVFRHIVIREVAYATLPRAERVRAHLRLARWSEDDAAERGEDVAELIAYHYRQAIVLAPAGKLPEGLDIGRVVRSLELAARSAWNGGAFVEAAEQLREAIRLAPPSEHLRLYEMLGDLMQFGDDAVSGYEEAFKRWRSTPGADPRIGARIRVKQLGVHARWTGSLSRGLQPHEFVALAAEAEELLAAAPDPFLAARLATCRAFELGSRLEADRAKLEQLVEGALEAQRFYKERGDAEHESEALDAIGSIYRAGFGDLHKALAAARERIAMSDRLGIVERADALNMVPYDLTLLGDFDGAAAAFDDARRSLRPGEPETVLAHAAAWVAYAASFAGRWDKTVECCEFIIACREDAGPSLGRFTTPGWFGGLRVAAARIDTTLLARYRSVFAAIADPKSMPEGHGARLVYEAMLDDDPAPAREALRSVTGARDRRAEAIRILLFDHRELIPEADLVAFERQVVRDAPLIALTIRLARAVSSGPDAMRVAIRELDAAHDVADAARTSALVALRTHSATDRAEAERRLGALGDRQYLQILTEEW
ncbi:MAG TPA: adenylate/guanylate cyclase domain-containing protein [Candidatus Limnocylindria bacterium]|jgi:class 3 adenylate cyclase/tetratricopeptide (TPR) repeat protein